MVRKGGASNQYGEVWWRGVLIDIAYQDQSWGIVLHLRSPVYPAAGDGRRRASVKSGWTYVGWEGGSEHMLVAGGWSEEA